MRSILRGTFALALERFSNEELAALNNAVQEWGHVHESNIAYPAALEAKLIKESGHPYDVEALRDALAYTVNARVEAGTFE